MSTKIFFLFLMVVIIAIYGAIKGVNK